MGNCSTKVKISQKKKHKTGIFAPVTIFDLKRDNFRLFYQIDSKISEDSNAAFYEITDKTTSEKRCLKSIQISPNSISNITREIEILQTIDHPNIVKIVDVFIEATHLNIITETCKGGELLQKLSSKKSISEKKIINYLKQIASALIYLHSKDIINRHLCPENILFVDEDEDLKLINFGKHGCFSNFKFQAPEALQGCYSTASDIWSLGVIAYLLCTGKLPFNNISNKEEFFIYIKTNDINFNSRTWERISDVLKNTIKNMLDKVPNNRPTAQEVFETTFPVSESKIIGGKLSGKILKRLSNYTRKDKFKRALLSFILNKVSFEEKEKTFRKLFKELDLNGDGTLSIKELVEGLKNYEVFLENPSDIVKSIDVNGDGVISYSEFIAALIDWEKELSVKRLTKVFNEVDINGDGVLSARELMKILGAEEIDKEFLGFVEAVDLNGDGSIDFKEFCAFVMGSEQKVWN